MERCCSALATEKNVGSCLNWKKQAFSPLQIYGAAKAAIKLKSLLKQTEH